MELADAGFVFDRDQNASAPVAARMRASMS